MTNLDKMKFSHETRGSYRNMKKQKENIIYESYFLIFEIKLKSCLKATLITFVCYIL